MNKKVSSQFRVGMSRHFCGEHSSSRPLKMEEILGYLNENKLKITQSRRDIIDLFLQKENHSLSTNSIILKLKKKDPKLNISTVYNNLDALCRVGVLKPNINMVTNQPVFELAVDPEPHIHAYNLDDDKEMIMKIDCALHDQLRKYFNEKNLVLEDYIIQAILRPKRNQNT